MSDPQPPLNQTPARREALGDVVFKLISYDPVRGQYLKGGTPVSGPRRRTLAELREYGYIKPGDPRRVAVVVLTNPEGEALAVEWGLKPSPPETGEQAVEAATE